MALSLSAGSAYPRVHALVPSPDGNLLMAACANAPQTSSLLLTYSLRTGGWCVGGWMDGWGGGLCVCVCVCLCVCVCTHAHIYVAVYSHMQIYTCARICIDVHMLSTCRRTHVQPSHTTIHSNNTHVHTPRIPSHTFTFRHVHMNVVSLFLHHTCFSSFVIVR